MSDTAVEDFLAHYGVKGMKWGERRAKKKLAKADKKWEKNINSVQTFVTVHNLAAERANSIDVPRINGKSEYANADFRSDSPLRRKYYQEHEDAFNARMKEAAIEVVGTNPSGTKKIHIDEEGVTRLVDVKHAVGAENIVLKFDQRGHIVAFEVGDDELEHDLLLVGEFLEHVGVKGMKWGQRKDRSNHGHNARARKAQALADRRPTRGNIRAAQIAKKRAERSEAKISLALTKPEKVVYSAAIGGLIAAKVLQKVGPVLVSKALRA